MTPYESKFQRTLDKALCDRKQEILEDMGQGVDGERYRLLAGWVKGIEDALKLMEEIRIEMQRGD